MILFQLCKNHCHRTRFSSQVLLHHLRVAQSFVAVGRSSRRRRCTKALGVPVASSCDLSPKPPETKMKMRNWNGELRKCAESHESHLVNCHSAWGCWRSFPLFLADCGSLWEAKLYIMKNSEAEAMVCNGLPMISSRRLLKLFGPACLFADLSAQSACRLKLAPSRGKRGAEGLWELGHDENLFMSSLWQLGSTTMR